MSVQRPTTQTVERVAFDKTKGRFVFPMKERYDVMHRQISIVPELIPEAEIAVFQAAALESEPMLNSDGQNAAEPSDEYDAVASRLFDPTDEVEENVDLHPGVRKGPILKSSRPAVDDPEISLVIPPTPAVSPIKGAPAGAKPISGDQASTVLVDGEQRPRIVLKTLIGPTGRAVRFVAGGSVLGSTFIRARKGSRAPDITVNEWSTMTGMSKFAATSEWNHLHPGHAIELPEANRSSASSSGDQGAPSAPSVVPAMPVVNLKHPVHRRKVPLHHPAFSAMVARPVGKKEIQEVPAAKASLQKEWDKLRKVGKRGCWDESRVQEKSVVLARARRDNITVHWGRIFEICVEKGSELKMTDPNRKYKGRVVFQGNNVKDQNYDQAIFAELGSAPATMEAGKAADAMGLLRGCTVEISDAEQAYTQA